MRRSILKTGIVWKEQVLRFLYPHTCPLCGRITGERICGVCQEKLEYIGEPRCMRCGKPVRQENREYCYDCEKHVHVYERGYALWIHSGSVKNSIYQFKYHNRRVYGRFFAEEFFLRYEKVVRRWNITTIIPIPLSKRRRRLRGYNQAEILADELGRMLSVPVNRKSLVRVKDTDPQKKMDVRGRKDNLKHAFAWKGQKCIQGNVLLVDDIYTTGSTIDHAARVLKEAGCGKVYFLTISIGQGY